MKFHSDFLIFYLGNEIDDCYDLRAKSLCSPNGQR